ncbi:MAG TPA: tripartite tricarboxylate transporter substrate binding protein [Candidatus Sulfotelmatobacter sp.]|nr:tripartite tricarboxylate transporter substrate binding protein [Candidatus Sulfotelmatobacter sp.]
MARQGRYGVRRILGMAVSVVALAIASAPAGAAMFPQKGKSIQLLIGWAAGASTDVGARILASGLEKELGTPVVPVNKPGASGQMTLTLLAASKPDGYTFGTTNFPSAIVSGLDPARKATYNRHSFQVLGLHVIDPTVFAVKSTSPYKTLRDLIEAAKAKPKTITITTTGVQSDEHFGILQLERMTGARFALVHFAQGGATALPPVLGGKVDIYGGNVADVLAQVKSGEMRVLGIMDEEESPFYPGIKTFEAQGYKLYNASSRGFSAPAGTPKEIIDILSGAMKKVVATEDHKKRMADMGLTLRYMTPEQYTKYWDETEAIIKELLPLTKE